MLARLFGSGIFVISFIMSNPINSYPFIKIFINELIAEFLILISYAQVAETFSFDSAERLPMKSHAIFRQSVKKSCSESCAITLIYCVIRIICCNFIVILAFIIAVAYVTESDVRRNFTVRRVENDISIQHDSSGYSLRSECERNIIRKTSSVIRIQSRTREISYAMRIFLQPFMSECESDIEIVLSGFQMIISAEISHVNNFFSACLIADFKENSFHFRFRRKIIDCILSRRKNEARDRLTSELTFYFTYASDNERQT